MIRPLVACLAVLWVLVGLAAADPAVPDATITGPGGMLDTWSISAGKTEGYAPGDRVKITRGGAPVGEASIFTVSPHSAIVSGPGLKLRKGDQVTFLHHKVAIAAGEETCIVTRIEGNPPGARTDVENKAIPGRINVFYYYTPAHAKCKELQAEFDAFLARMKRKPHTAVFIIDVGYEGSPLAVQYNAQSLPTLGIMNAIGQWTTVAHGHGCREVFNNSTR
jgi:hypothetical protein